MVKCMALNLFLLLIKTPEKHVKSLFITMIIVWDLYLIRIDHYSNSIFKNIKLGELNSSPNYTFIILVYRYKFIINNYTNN
jgi:hypothetical protein